MPGEDDLDRLTAVQTLAVDAAARELSEAFARAGIEAILLKGGSLQWLYEGEARPYGDIDVLVAPDRVAQAQGVLAARGFRTGPGLAPPQTPHARPWLRPGDGAVADLHWTVSGSCLGPRETWEVLRSHADWSALGGGEVLALDRTAGALLVVLHASQHGSGKPVADLDRLLERLEPDEWPAVLSLAERLNAEYGLADGLRLRPAGRDLAARLGLPPPALLHATGNAWTGLVLGIDRLRRARSGRERAGLLAREAFPDPDFMRWRFSLARRGRRGLGASYLWRLTSLAWRLIPSLLAWRRSVRGGSASE